MLNGPIKLRREGKPRFVASLYKDRPRRLLVWFGYLLIVGGSVSFIADLFIAPDLIDLALRAAVATIGAIYVLIWRARCTTVREIEDRPLAPLEASERSIKVKAKIRRD